MLRRGRRRVAGAARRALDRDVGRRAQELTIAHAERLRDDREEVLRLPALAEDDQVAAHPHAVMLREIGVAASTGVDERGQVDLVIRQDPGDVTLAHPQVGRVIQEGRQRHAEPKQLRLDRFVAFMHEDLVRDGL